MIILGNNKDKFGFYQVGDRCTYSKVEAIEWHKNTGIHPHWNFHEEFFSSYNWMVEPEEDMETLYARRAQQIRETYDYVVIPYSGGADSQNILDSFVNNNIKVDEVLTYNIYNTHNDNNDIDTSELIQEAWPRIKQLHDKGVEFKHRHIDLSDQMHRVLTDPKMRLERSYYANTNYGTMHLCTTYFRETEPDYIKLVESDKKMVFVWGIDKPRIYYENEKYCLKFLDITDSGTRVRTQMLNRQNEYDEFFYWAPEAVDMICKQGHIVKNFLKKCHAFKSEVSNDDTFTQVKSWVNEKQGQLTVPPELNFLHAFSPLELINWLVYKDHDPRKIFSVGKPLTRLVSYRETKINSDAELNVHVRYIIQRFKNIDSYWWKESNSPAAGLKNCVSPNYYLE